MTVNPGHAERIKNLIKGCASFRLNLSLKLYEYLENLVKFNKSDKPTSTEEIGNQSIEFEKLEKSILEERKKYFLDFINKFSDLLEQTNYIEIKNDEVFPKLPLLVCFNLNAGFQVKVKKGNSPILLSKFLELDALEEIEKLISPLAEELENSSQKFFNKRITELKQIIEKKLSGDMELTKNRSDTLYGGTGWSYSEVILNCLKNFSLSFPSAIMSTHKNVYDVLYKYIDDFTKYWEGILEKEAK